MTKQRQKSENDIRKQARRILTALIQRGEGDSNRANQVRSVAVRYIRNLDNTRSRQNDNKKVAELMRSDNPKDWSKSADVFHKGYIRKYSRSTYMGLNGG